MKYLILSALAVAISTTAFAKDLKGTVMTDSEMDKVSAGQGFGLSTAGGNGFEHGFYNGIEPHAAGNAHSPGTPGFGLCTAGRASCP